MREGELGREFRIAVGFRGAAAHAVLGCEFVQVVAPVEPELLVPTVRAAARPEVVRAIQMPLADVRRMDALVAQALADGVHRLPERQAVGPHSIGMRKGAGKKRGARWRADRLAGISAVEADAALGHAIEIGSLKSSPPVAVQHVPARRVGHDHDGAPGFGLRGQRRPYRPRPVRRQRSAGKCVCSFRSLRAGQPPDQVNLLRAVRLAICAEHFVKPDGRVRDPCRAFSRNPTAEKFASCPRPDPS